MDRTQREICGYLDLALPDTDWIVVLADSTGQIISSRVTGQRVVELLSNATARVRREFPPATPLSTGKRGEAARQGWINRNARKPYRDLVKLEQDLEKWLGSTEGQHLKNLLNMSVNEIEFSVRVANCLNNANITTVGQLVIRTESDLLKYRNFGPKCLAEVKAKLQQLGTGLGWEFEPGLVEPNGEHKHQA
jgi:hypothetical protein